MGLEREKPGRGRPRGMPTETVARVLEATRRAISALTLQGVAAAAGTSVSTVHRIWIRYGIDRHCTVDRIETAIRQVISEHR